MMQTLQLGDFKGGSGGGGGFGGGGGGGGGGGTVRPCYKVPFPTPLFCYILDLF